MYKPQIAKSEKLLTMIKTIQDELSLGQHSGLLTFEEFSYLYLFLDWTQDKKDKSRHRKNKSKAGEYK